MSKVKKVIVASYLSEELLIEIIKRLPVKYILRCRCVQKSWYTLLRSSYFIALHSRHQNTSNKYLLFYNCDKRYFSLRFDDTQCKQHCHLRFPRAIEAYLKSRGEVVYETCNGLICLSSTMMHEVFIWNPCLRVFHVLPDSPLPTHGSPIHHPTTLGLAFVYLPKTNDYKVIKYIRECDQFYVYAYSVSSDSWKIVKKAKVGRFSMNKLSNSVVVNGTTAYWVANTSEIWMNGKVIVCFDMKKDTIREITLPPPYSKENAHSDVLVHKSIIGELLSLFYYNRSTYVLHIWELENAGKPTEIWMKKNGVNFEPNWRRPLGFRNNGEIVFKSHWKFLPYDLEKNEAKHIVHNKYLGVFNWAGDLHPFPQQGLNRFEDNLVLLDVNRKATIHVISQRGDMYKHGSTKNIWF